MTPAPTSYAATMSYAVTTSHSVTTSYAAAPGMSLRIAVTARATVAFADSSARRTEGSARSGRVSADPSRLPGPPSRLEEHLPTVVCRRVLHVAQTQARRQGLRGEAAEDCALEFVERMLLADDWRALRPPGQEQVDRQRTPPEPSSEAWLRRCAGNFARNVHRRDVRLSQRERVWPEWRDDEGEGPDWEPVALQETPEARLLRSELAQRIEAAARRLTPAQRELFERILVDEESVGEVAASLGRTPHAVSQALLTLRQRLRGLLERQGLDERAVEEYLGASEAGRAASYFIT